MRIMATEPLADAVLVPASDSDADITAHVRHTAQTEHPPVGTCRMGVDPESVSERSRCSAEH